MKGYSHSFKTTLARAQQVCSRAENSTVQCIKAISWVINLHWNSHMSWVSNTLLTPVEDVLHASFTKDSRQISSWSVMYEVVSCGVYSRPLVWVFIHNLWFECLFIIFGLSVYSRPLVWEFIHNLWSECLFIICGVSFYSLVFFVLCFIASRGSWRYSRTSLMSSTPSCSSGLASSPGMTRLCPVFS